MIPEVLCVALMQSPHGSIQGWVKFLALRALKCNRSDWNDFNHMNVNVGRADVIPSNIVLINSGTDQQMPLTPY